MIFKEPTVDNYLHMCANKTGGLARMCAKMSGVLAGATPDQVEAIGRFAESLGIAFQIQDDILNIDQAGSLSLSKGNFTNTFCDDPSPVFVKPNFIWLHKNW